MERKTHHAIIYALLALIVLCLVALTLKLTKDTASNEGVDAQWICSSLTCANTIEPQQWIEKNCVIDSQTGEQNCLILINGKQERIPLIAINLTYLAQQCETYLCLQEAYVRTVNYTVAVNTSSLQVFS